MLHFQDGVSLPKFFSQIHQVIPFTAPRRGLPSAGGPCAAYGWALSFVNCSFSSPSDFYVTCPFGPSFLPPLLECSSRSSFFLSPLYCTRFSIPRLSAHPLQHTDPVFENLRLSPSWPFDPLSAPTSRSTCELSISMRVLFTRDCFSPSFRNWMPRLTARLLRFFFSPFRGRIFNYVLLFYRVSQHKSVVRFPWRIFFVRGAVFTPAGPTDRLFFTGIRSS